MSNFRIGTSTVWAGNKLWINTMKQTIKYTWQELQHENTFQNQPSLGRLDQPRICSFMAKSIADPEGQLFEIVT